jgi:intraflagellar transport protein 172
MVLGLYRHLVKQVLARRLDDEGPGFPLVIRQLRDVLYRLSNQYRSSGGTSKQSKNEVEELLLATHYQHMLNECRNFGLKDLAAKAAVTLLKYPDLLPQDKAFYQAGMICKEVGDNNMGFMLLNRYVDIVEAIDAQDASYLDNSEYHEADAIPLDAALPTDQYAGNERDREDVRTWVLSVVTDSTIEQRFPNRQMARGTLYEGIFSSDRPACIVTGFPVHGGDILEVNNSTANRRDWNIYVNKSKQCPWTGVDASPLY